MDDVPSAVSPATNADRDSGSSFGREEVQDALTDYEEALVEAREKSSSDWEEAAEARVIM
jgi:hypothetical protein